MSFMVSTNSVQRATLGQQSVFTQQGLKAHTVMEARYEILTSDDIYITDLINSASCIRYQSTNSRKNNMCLISICLMV